MRLRALGLVLVLALAGCSMFAGNPVPPAPKLVGIQAQDAAWKSQVKRSPDSGAAIFMPLQQARAALAAAKAQAQVHDYGGQALQQAEQALTEAESGWKKLADKPRRSAAQLAGVADNAHRALRMAEIAEYSAQREIGLRQLATLDSRLQQGSATAPDNGGESLVGQKVIPDRFGAVAFKPGTAHLTDSSHATIRRLARWMQANPTFGVAIYGHTDNTAPSDARLQAFIKANPTLAKRKLSHTQKVSTFNTALSSVRARSVGQALVDDGVTARRIAARGFGAQRPVASNDTPAGRRANRRVVAIIVRQPDRQAGTQTQTDRDPL